MNQERQRLHSLTKEIAIHLGPEWAYQETPAGDNWRVVTIKGQNEAAITLRFEKNRLKIKGREPAPIHDEGNGWWAPYGDAIGCSATKRPGQIAKDIEGRLLSIYLPKYLEQLESRRQYIEETAHEKALRIQLAAVIPGSTVRSDNKIDLPYTDTYHLSGTMGIHLRNGIPLATFDLSGVSLDAALAISRILASEMKGEQK